jgi:hypothetical protein
MSHNQSSVGGTYPAFRSRYFRALSHSQFPNSALFRTTSSPTVPFSTLPVPNINIATTNLHTARMSSNSDPLATVYHQAFQRYQELHDDRKLKDEHFDLIKGRNTIEEVLDAIRNAKTNNESERNAVLRVIRRTSEHKVDNLSRFEGVAGTAIEASKLLPCSTIVHSLTFKDPNVSALVWGGVKLITVVTLRQPPPLRLNRLRN